MSRLSANVYARSDGLDISTINQYAAFAKRVLNPHLMEFAMTLRFTTLARCCTAALAACSPQPAASDNHAASAVAKPAASEAGSVTIDTARRRSHRAGQSRTHRRDDWACSYAGQAGCGCGRHHHQYPPGLSGKTPPATCSRWALSFEPDYEALHAFAPQLIITGSRTAPRRSAIEQARAHHRDDRRHHQNARKHLRRASMRLPKFSTKKPKPKR